MKKAYVAIFCILGIHLTYGQICSVDGSQATIIKYPPTSRSVENQSVTWYMETDYYTYQAFNSNADSVYEWVKHLFDQVAMIYKNELNIVNKLLDIKIATTEEDDWSSEFGYGKAWDLLVAFKQKRDTLSGVLKHFVSLKPIGRSFSELPGLYSVSVNLYKNEPNYPTPSWSVYTIAHESGHALNAAHTHDCVWGDTNNKAIDTCGGNFCNVLQPIESGTIMSYCYYEPDGINLSFGTYPSAAIKSYVSYLSDVFNSLECLDTLQISGTISGVYRANVINLDNIESSGFLFLSAKEININDGAVNEYFVTDTIGCN